MILTWKTRLGDTWPTNCWMHHLNLWTSATQVMTKFKTMFINIVDKEIFEMKPKLTIFIADQYVKIFSKNGRFVESLIHARLKLHWTSLCAPPAYMCTIHTRPCITSIGKSKIPSLCVSQAWLWTSTLTHLPLWKFVSLYQSTKRHL